MSAPNNLRLLSLITLCLLALARETSGQQPVKKFDQQDKFRQLEELLPTPTDYRAASGVPGKDYWQQAADYEIDVEIDDADQRLIGSEKIAYANHSPDTLQYLWLQLDPNIRDPHSDANLTDGAPDRDSISYDQLRGMLARQGFDGGIKITAVQDLQTGKPLNFTIVKTMMRVDLPMPLAPQQTFGMQVEWNYNINNSKLVRGRTGYEFFEEDGNYLYELAQWYPRLCAYTDVTGWQHKQFLGRGEFTLEFGDYTVRITVPNDHVVAATGVLINGEQVLSVEQRRRLSQAENADHPMFIITPEEAAANERSNPAGKKTWIFRAERVRDFAFASSRKFIWDAIGHNVGERKVMAMSFYPREGEPLWSRYSTHAIVHTLDVYSKFTFPYPYPVAISVNGPVGGMEYPMISFNGPRPEKDGTYSARTKYGLISVVIHEVGHNWFPMIVNSDERQWTWMDEGLNTFLQYLAEQEWEEKYPSRRGDPREITEYMSSPDQVPVMTNSESLLQFGPNAYAKPATALNILRETVLGRELFDFAFKQYATRWQFKRPMPADFFRSIEDASGVDLDWFWRGWFYSTDHVDIAIDGVSEINLDSESAYLEKPKQRDQRDRLPTSVGAERNQQLPKRTEQYPQLKDFYNQYDEHAITPQDRQQYEQFIEQLGEDDRKLLSEKPNLYAVRFRNVGGLVMPIILEIEFIDGSKQMMRIPAEIWRYDNQQVAKLLITEKRIKQLVLDPRLETADIDLSNNFFPPRIEAENMRIGPGEDERKEKNPMQKARESEEPKAKG